MFQYILGWHAHLLFTLHGKACATYAHMLHARAILHIWPLVLHLSMNALERRPIQGGVLEL
jgi:hypothetical protein